MTNKFKKTNLISKIASQNPKIYCLIPQKAFLIPQIKNLNPQKTSQTPFKPNLIPKIVYYLIPKKYSQN